nr:hypothetical protein BaRGS_008784 [Batillaria attramentaria]
MTSHWEFYSQTGICIPLPITRRDFEGRDYSFGVMIVFNFVLFLLIAGGQATIYRSVQGNILTTDTTKRSQDLTIARRLLTVVVSNFLCWFPVGLLGLLASGGVPISGEVTVAIAIFVLPLNSALNPFLYTLNMLTERRRKRQEMRLMKVLESRLASQKTDLTSSKTCVSSDNLQASLASSSPQHITQPSADNDDEEDNDEEDKNDDND